MEQTHKRRAERTRESAIDETQIQESTGSDAVEETDVLLDEIDEILESVDEHNRDARSLIDLLDEEASFEDDPDEDVEAVERELWELGLYAPSDLPQWLQDELGGNPCPFCGCDPCRGVGAWLASGPGFK